MSDVRAILGFRPRAVAPYPLYFAFIVFVVACCTVFVAETGPAAKIVAVAAMVAAAIVSMRWWRGGLLKSNVAHEALSREELERAEALTLEVLRRPAFEAVVAVCLQRLGEIAYRREDFPRAVVLLEAAAQIERRRHFGPHPGPLAAAVTLAAQANLALGRVEDAARCLVQADAALPTAASLAATAKTRALLLARTGRHAEALAVVEAERPLVRNALHARESMLLDAIEAVSRNGGDSYRVGAPVAPPVSVDAEGKAYVLRLLPEAAPLLVDSEW